MKTIEYNGRSLQVLDSTNPSLARRLTPEEEQEFIEWAQKNFEQEIKAIYHPVVQNAMLDYKRRAKLCSDCIEYDFGPSHQPCNDCCNRHPTRTCFWVCQY